MLKNILKTFIIFLFLGTVLNAQVNIWGDLEVRPRMDVYDNGDYGNRTENFYYMYRARLNFKAEIGDGWFAQTQLGHNGYGGYGFAGFKRTENLLAGAIEGATRPAVHFINMYFGHSSKEWSFFAGLVPINAIANPVYDVHYYPNKIIDIPFVIYSVNAAFGFKGHVNVLGNKLNLMLLVDSGTGSLVEDNQGNTLSDKQDNYTLGAEYEMQFEKLSVTPVVYFAMAADSTIAPFTVGANFTHKTTDKLTLFLHAAYSTQSNDYTTEYDVIYLRPRVDYGNSIYKATVWYDYAVKTDKYDAGDVEHNFGHIWTQMNFRVYKSDKGQVNIKPRFRYGTETVDNMKDYSRMKVEVCTTIQF